MATFIVLEIAMVRRLHEHSGQCVAKELEPCIPTQQPSTNIFSSFVST